MRHAVIWPAQAVEPDPNGDWVPYQEFYKLKVDLDRCRNESAEAVKNLRSTLSDTRQHSRGKDEVIEGQKRAIQAARERITLLGHMANCQSRCSYESEGQVVRHACNCGLDNWMRESGLC